MKAHESEQRRIKLEENQKVVAEKLAKTSCNGGIPGECGPGRACVYNEISYFGQKEIIKGSGVCKSNADADRLVAESNEQRRHQQLMQKLDNIGDSRSNVMNPLPNSGGIDRDTKDNGCSSDYSCGIGYKCVKAPFKSSGVCMKSVNDYGTPVYNTPRSDRIGIKNEGQCMFNTDCPIGFKCDQTYKACVK